MTIDIQGNRGSGVAQASGGDDYRNVVVQHQGGCRVAQVMEADGGQSGIREQILELPEQIAGMDGGANAGSEDEIWYISKVNNYNHLTGALDTWPMTFSLYL